MPAPQYPIGPLRAGPDTAETREELIETLAEAPGELAAAVERLPDGGLGAKYVNWTARQIVNHLAESHLHSFIRFKWALTEENPTIKPYDESACATLPDAVGAPVDDSLALFRALHGRWVYLLRAMTPDQFKRAFFPPGERRGCLAVRRPPLLRLAQPPPHGPDHVDRRAGMRNGRLGLPSVLANSRVRTSGVPRLMHFPLTFPARQSRFVSRIGEGTARRSR
ncbi:MAG: DinB family protein [Planctomycetota bacterium]